MSIYANVARYFSQCLNCGECCRIPGVFLPEQIPILANHLGLSVNSLFDQYLIAELCAPDDWHVPVFALSPVKAKPDGSRLSQRVFDSAYAEVRNLRCIFRDSGKCRIHEYKPFACALLLCPRMTSDESLSLGKSYYYHRWKDKQDVMFSMFPALEPIYERLKESVAGLNKSLQIRNTIINCGIGTLFNGSPIDGTPIYR